MTRRRYTPTFKALMVQDPLKEEKTLPKMWNSDQGSHFTSPQYRELLLGAGMRISMDGTVRALDNVFVER